MITFPPSKPLEKYEIRFCRGAEVAKLFPHSRESTLWWLGQYGVEVDDEGGYSISNGLRYEVSVYLDGEMVQWSDLRLGGQWSGQDRSGLEGPGSDCKAPDTGGLRHGKNRNGKG